jgi:ABC-type Fe3+ transport system substrate-binding protein
VDPRDLRTASRLVERAAHPNAAKLYIDFVLSREGQEALRSVQRIPVRQDVDADPPNLIKGYARVTLRPMEKEEFDEVVEPLQDNLQSSLMRGFVYTAASGCVDGSGSTTLG